MNIKILRFTPILVLAALMGCGGPTPPTQASVAADAQRSALNTKMSGMSKEQRAQYVKDHMAEISATLESQGQTAHNPPRGGQ
jgi:hypothetical protein